MNVDHSVFTSRLDTVRFGEPACDSLAAIVLFIEVCIHYIYILKPVLVVKLSVLMLRLFMKCIGVLTSIPSSLRDD